MALRVVVDRGRCNGYAQCHYHCPEVFDLDDQGHVVVLMDIVPADVEAAARRAEASCPESVITLLDDQQGGSGGS